MGADASLRDRFELGLAAPICLTWELTWACNLACIHCLSSSGRRDPRELTTAEAVALIDEFAAMQVFYVNVGGGEPTIRRDFFDLLDHAVDRNVGVKFSTNGTRIDAARARRLAAMDYVDVQVSIDGATARGQRRGARAGSFDAALAAMGELADAGFGRFKVSVVVTRDERQASSTTSRRSRAVRRPAAPDEAAALGARRRDLGRAAADRRTEPRPLPLAARPPRHAHGRLVLPPLGVR